MIMRFATHSIRFQVSSDELEQLHGGKSLGLEVSLPHGHMVRTKVAPANDWLFDSDPTGIWLNVPRDEIDALLIGAQSKEGISHAFATNHGNLEISLEIESRRAR